MAGRILSDDQRAARNEMVFACVELRKNLIALERCLTAAKLSELAAKASRLVRLFARLEHDAKGDRPVEPSALSTTARVFNDVAIKLGEACELVEVLESAVARHHMELKLARLGELTAQAFLLVDLAMEDA